MVRHSIASLIFMLLGLFSKPLVAQSERIAIPDTGFTIVPPQGWDVQRNTGGSSLLFRAPKIEGQVSYQPTIQIMTFSGFRYIDDVTQKEYGQLIVDKLGTASNQISDYRLRSQEKVILQSGDEAILYYTEFNMSGVPLMQLHVLISSAHHHFLMTYTDLATVFEDETGQALQVAYSSMYSALMDSKPPSRFQSAIIGLGVFIVFLVLWLLFRWIKKYRLTRLGERIEEEEQQELQADEEARHYSRQSSLSHIGPGKSTGHWADLEDQDADEEEATTRLSEPARTHEKRERMREQNRRAAAPPRKVQIDPPASASRPNSDLRRSDQDVPHSLDPKTTLAIDTTIVPGEKDSVPADRWHIEDEVPSGVQPQHTRDVPSPYDAPILPPPPPARSPPNSFPRGPALAAVPQDPASLREPRAPEPETFLTEEARLSEILPRAGTIAAPKVKKKRGLFWRKTSEEDAEEAEDARAEPDSDVWALTPSRSSRRDEEEDLTETTLGPESRLDVTPSRSPTKQSTQHEEADWSEAPEPAEDRRVRAATDDLDEEPQVVVRTLEPTKVTARSSRASLAPDSDKTPGGDWLTDGRPVAVRSRPPLDPESSTPLDDREADSRSHSSAPTHNSLLNETRPQRLIRSSPGNAAPALATAAPLGAALTDDEWNLGVQDDGSAPDEDQEDDDDPDA